ncbi:MAG: 4-(cytidine 5'-diphospho)-2-C-methyl-D-erythritol kinase [Pseudonocardiales bacterium]|nr:MAG: 4-(cytidine 5'-diphospho)-2-C-methyl-D-erythritol kinase [Pseudonocardiales bacterium]
MTRLQALAPGKVNLCLYLGERRDDGLHELVSLVQAVELADEIVLEPAPPGARSDEAICAGVEGPNLAVTALAAYRAATGWDPPPQRLSIDKRIPVAAGMGGGSSDAAAALRLAAQAAGTPDDPRLDGIAPELGADVVSLLRPGLVLMTGAGEQVSPVTAMEPFAVLVIIVPERLSTAEVYREADRLGLSRTHVELHAMRREIESALRGDAKLPLELLHNDLEPAARSLCPDIDAALQAAGAAGAQRALVSGSGPTVFGVFPGLDPAVDFGALEGYPGARLLAPLTS